MVSQAGHNKGPILDPSVAAPRLKTRNVSPVHAVFRERCLQIPVDDKLVEMKSFVAKESASSLVHNPEGPAQDIVEPQWVSNLKRRPREPSPPKAPEADPRSEGIRTVDNLVRGLAAASSPRASHGESSAHLERLGSKSSCSTPRDAPSRLPSLTPRGAMMSQGSKLLAALEQDDEVPQYCAYAELRSNRRNAWKKEVNKSMRRLLDDVEFARDTTQAEEGYQMSCEQFDRLYDWYRHNGRTEDKKEREAPAHVRFDASRPPWPGSLRRDKAADCEFHLPRL